MTQFHKCSVFNLFFLFRKKWWFRQRSSLLRLQAKVRFIHSAGESVSGANSKLFAKHSVQIGLTENWRSNRKSFKESCSVASSSQRQPSQGRMETKVKFFLEMWTWKFLRSHDERSEEHDHFDERSELSSKWTNQITERRISLVGYAVSGAQVVPLTK